MLQFKTAPRAKQMTHPVTSRSSLARLLQTAATEIFADHYLLVQPSVERGPKSMRIVTSNWVFDALEDFGSDGIAKIIEGGDASNAGACPRPLDVAELNYLSATEREALVEHGHSELYCQKLQAGGTAVFALFSAATRGQIDPVSLRAVHMKCCYGLAQFFKSCGGPQASDPLSERERECLLWVSEGKTTDEVALILGVSSNTVNSYVAHAIQKFGASNRAMAIATAIRSGII
jgi:DNA-binding CsgD family transcriptional regulator